MTDTKDRYLHGTDPREVANYSVTEAAKYVGLAPATLRSWVRGRHYRLKDGLGYFEPPIQPPERGQGQLSFWNLVESHVLRALRVEHGVSMEAVRSALDYAEARLGIRHLLRHKDLGTRAGDLFIERYGELVNLTQSGQLALQRLLKDQLKHVEWNPHDSLAERLFPAITPFGRHDLIMIDPRIGFGRPVVRQAGVSTAVIASRIDAGESVPSVADDYDLDPETIEEVLIDERAA